MNILQVKNENGEWVSIPAIQGPKGDPGETYVITEADYDAIAAIVMSKLPSTEEVSY